MRFRLTLVFCGLLGASAPGLCQQKLAKVPKGAEGVWLVEERDARVRIGSCGDALCGWISWVRDTSADKLIGRRVVSNMKIQGDGVWAGALYNPRDGRSYSGRMNVSGDALAMTGCLAGTVLCKTFSWERVK